MARFTGLCFCIIAIFLQNSYAEDKGSPFDDIIKVNLQAGSTFSAIGENTMPKMFEGDIVMTKSLQTDVENMEYAAKHKISKFDAMTRAAWTNGIVPYSFDRYFNSKGRQVVRQAIAEYNKYTCLKFIPRTNQRSYVTFFHGRGCYSMIGQQGGPQRISLANPGCLHKGVTIHEMMHAAGFYHEQSRLDRDKYIVIDWNNIMSGVSYNFKKYRSGQASYLGAGYDKQSIMHYGNYAFSKNGRKTIYSRRSYNEVLGQRRGFSTIDKQQLNKLYKCGKTTTTTTTTGSKCSDTYVFCKALKSYCSHSWVMKYCKKSCNRCSRPPVVKPSNCKDKSPHCGAWKRYGYCKSSSRYSGFMRGNCKKSCGSC